MEGKRLHWHAFEVIPAEFLIDIVLYLFHWETTESHRFCNRVQDAYTLRCTPQVHGIVHDTIDFVRTVIVNEMNSATDNPVNHLCHIHSVYYNNDLTFAKALMDMASWNNCYHLWTYA